MKIYSIALVSFLSVLSYFATAQKSNFEYNLSTMIQPIGEENINKTDGYFNWGGSIIKGKKGNYHLFYSRWKKEYSFLGWLTHSEVAHAVSNNPTGPWKYVNTVLKGRGYKHWDAVNAHNPKIKYFEGKYYLYYISTNFKGKKFNENQLKEICSTGYSHPEWKKELRPNQRTGVAVAESLDGQWKRFEKPLIEPSFPIETLTVNPAITKSPGGRYVLIVKGDKIGSPTRDRSQVVAFGDTPLGPFKIEPKPVIGNMDTEDMSIWYDKRVGLFYGVFHAHTYIGLVSSSDGENWEKAKYYKLTDKKIKTKKGINLQIQRLERPFVYVEENTPKTLCLSVMNKNESYNIFIPLK